MNQFALSKYSKTIKSNFHMIAEPLSNLKWEEYKDAIDISLSHYSYCYVVHPDVIKYNLNKLKRDDLFTLKYSFVKLCDFLFGDIILDKRMPIPQCSGSALLALSISLDYKNIYIIGMDQDQLSKKVHINKNFHSNHKNNLPSLEANFNN